MKKILTFSAMFLLLGLLFSCSSKDRSADAEDQYQFDPMDDRTLEYSKEILAADSTFSLAYTWCAMYYFFHEDYDQACIEIDNAIRHWKKGDSYTLCFLYKLRGDIYKAIEWYDFAILEYDNAYENISDEDTPDVVQSLLFERSEAYYYLGDFDQAEAGLKQVLLRDEKDANAMGRMSGIMFIKRDYESALAWADRCLQADEDYYDGYGFRMLAYAGLGKTHLAIDDAFRYVDKSDTLEDKVVSLILKKDVGYVLSKSRAIPDTEYANKKHLALIRPKIYEWTHDYVNAIREYNWVDRLCYQGETDSLLSLSRSYCYNEIGHHDQAIREITRYINEQEEVDPLLILKRAEYYREAGRYDEAIADYTAVIEADPTMSYSYFGSGWCYELKGDDKSAMSDYDLGIFYDDFPYIRFMRGEQYLKQGKKDLAQEDFEMVLEMDAEVSLSSCRHYALHYLGKDREALEWMDQVIALDPEDGGIYYEQSCLLAMMGRKSQAIAALRKAFEKGYRAFAHIEHDDHMDPIRNHPNFIALVREYKGKPIVIE